ncbi:MAG: hypothetical protein LBB61_00455 [Treponema sp.]|jgi:hypothetical protein|nr:hypothetical protein [Treponema sp.]
MISSGQGALVTAPLATPARFRQTPPFTPILTPVDERVKQGAIVYISSRVDGGRQTGVAASLFTKSDIICIISMF